MRAGRRSAHKRARGALLPPLNAGEQLRVQRVEPAARSARRRADRGAPAPGPRPRRGARRARRARSARAAAAAPAPSRGGRASPRSPAPRPARGGFRARARASARPAGADRAPPAPARAGDRSARRTRRGARRRSRPRPTASAHRRSATKSAMVTSVSWPTPEITGTGQRPMARATISSLNAQRSSIDPPPRTRSTTSTPGTRPTAPSARATILRGALALDARRPNHDVRLGIAAVQHREDVANRRAVERGDHADLPRQHRQRPLARLIEQPFGGEPPLQLLERQLQRAQPARLERLADDLILALGVVDAHAAARDDVLAVLDLELEEPRRRAEHHARESARRRP